MYFWRIAKLKSDLAASTVGEREALFYLLWFGGVTTLASALPLGDFNLWDYVDSATMLVAFLAGTAYAFSCNGGAAGRHFLLRYVSLNWVFGIRFLVLVAIPIIVLVLAAEEWFMPGGVPEVTTPWESLLMAGLEVAFYLRLGQHVRDVANAEAAV